MLESEDHVAVILAGGQGSRLKPYTSVLPKPLMPVGNTPILEIIIGQLRGYGFRRLILAVNHFDGLLRSYFGGGESFGVEISYSREDRPLGTVGPLHGMADRLPETFLMMNGDILTDTDYAACFQAHRSAGRSLTLGVLRRRVQVPDGVIDIAEDGSVARFREKPTIDMWISMGVYVLDRSVLELVPPDRPSGMDDLVLTMLDRGMAVNTYRHLGEWHDIGSPENLKQAGEAFRSRREKFLPLDVESASVV